MFLGYLGFKIFCKALLGVAYLQCSQYVMLEIQLRHQQHIHCTLIKLLIKSNRLEKKQLKLKAFWEKIVEI